MKLLIISGMGIVLHRTDHTDLTRSIGAKKLDKNLRFSHPMRENIPSSARSRLRLFVPFSVKIITSVDSININVASHRSVLSHEIPGHADALYTCQGINPRPESLRFAIFGVCVMRRTIEKKSHPPIIIQSVFKLFCTLSSCLAEMNHVQWLYLQRMDVRS